MSYEDEQEEQHMTAVFIVCLVTCIGCAIFHATSQNVAGTVLCVGMAIIVLMCAFMELTF